MSSHHWLVNAVGLAGGLISMASFVPQIVKIVRERDASGVSLSMYAVTIVGFVCWTAYGVLIESWPVGVSNGVCVALTIAIFILRLRFGEGGAEH